MSDDPLAGDEAPETPEAQQARILYLQYRSEHWDDNEGFEQLLNNNPGLRPELEEEERKWPDVKELLRWMLPSSSGGEGCSLLLQTIQSSMNGSSKEAGEAGPAEEVMRAVEQSDLSDRYQVLKTLHRTRQSLLFLVYDGKLARKSVMKVLLDTQASADLGPFEGLLDTDSMVSGQDRARLLKEALVTSQLEHPAIVPVYDVGVDVDGRLCFVMKLIEGQTFGEIIPRVHDPADDWTLNRAVGVLRRICEALAYAHSRNVMHRDIKPHNFMVGRFGEAILMDWGLHLSLKEHDESDPNEDGEGGLDGLGESGPPAEARDDMGADGDTELDPTSPLASWALSNRFGPAGTPIYMSPEQARGHRDRLGPASDIYSLGVVLYHLILGKPPYLEVGMTETVPSIMRKVATRAPDALGQVCPSAPAELIAICERAMEREVEQRYGSAEEFGDALAEYLEAVSKDRQEAVRQGRRARTNSDFLLDVLSERDPNQAQGRNVTVLEAIERAARRIESDPPAQVEDAVALRGVLGGLYTKMGRPHEARVQLTAAHRALVELGVQWRSDALAMASRLAWCEHACGDSAAAASALREILAEQERLAGPMDPGTLKTCWLLAQVQHYSTSRFDEVRGLYERVIAGFTKLDGETSLDVLNAKNGLARIMQEMGHQGRALELQEQAVDGMIATFGRSHTDTLIQMGDLASMYAAVGRTDRAERLVAHVLEVQDRVLGGDHAHTQVTRNNLAMLYRQQGKLDVAREVAQEVWESHTKTAGENALWTLTMHHNLATIDLDLGAAEQAEQILLDCTGRLKKLYPKHRLLARARTNLARCLLMLHRPQEAREELLPALELLRIVLEPGSQWTLDAEELLAQCDREGDSENS